MQTLFNVRFHRALSAIAAVSAFALPISVAHGQQALTEMPSDAAGTDQTKAEPTLNLDVRSALHDGAVGVSSSSSAAEEKLPGELVALGAAPAGFGAAADGSLQPPPYRRRRYGSPSYSDRFHNADGSSKIGAVIGGGFNFPVGDGSSNYLKTSWRFEGGLGYNLSKKFGVMAQFDWDNFGLPGSVLANQQALYSALDPTDAASGDFDGLDGHSHIWSLTLNPTMNFYQSDTLGAYAVVGGGFYHKVTDFTLPATGEAYNPYYGYYTYTANQTFDQYVSNSAGVTGGIGVTYKFSRFANEKFFAEARFVHTFNQARGADPNVEPGQANPTAYNYYPPNSNETDYIPITIGIRF